MWVRYYIKHNGYIQFSKNLMKVLLFLFVNVENKRLNIFKYSKLLNEFQGLNTNLSNFNILFLLLYLWGVFCSWLHEKQHNSNRLNTKPDMRIWPSSISQTLKGPASMYIIPKSWRTTALTLSLYLHCRTHDKYRRDIGRILAQVSLQSQSSELFCSCSM